jgi:SAM-dependent methyltransferase
MIVQHNSYGKTKMNRYPLIFAKCKELLWDASSILSFGCSTGEECVSLADIYYDTANITGVESIPERLEKAIRHRAHPRVRYLSYQEFESDKEIYDIIFCMSVLCRWPEMSNQYDCSRIYPFELFEREVIKLTKKLRECGLFVIYNSSFFLEDTRYGYLFEQIPVNAREEDVQKFDKYNLRTNKKAQTYIFKKRGLMY